MPRKIQTPTKADRLAATNDAADQLQHVLDHIYNGNWKPQGNGTWKPNTNGLQHRRPTARELKAYRLTKENML